MAARRRALSLIGAAREIVFGMEDSFVSTLGATVGVAVGSGSRFIVILTGMVLVAVEAISMAAGSYLSTKAANEISRERAKQDTARLLQERVTDEESLGDMLRRKGLSTTEVKTVMEALGRERKLWLKEVARAEYRFHTGSSVQPGFAAVVMGVSYVLGGTIVLLPYFFFDMLTASLLSLLVAIFALFTLGVWKARLAEVPAFRSGFEMVMVSLVAAALGVLVGRLADNMLGS